MSKYIIEIEDEPFVRLSALFGEEGLYRAKGFNSLVFDQFGLDKLTPIDKALDEAYQKGFEVGQHEATTLEYQRGLDDAWGFASHLAYVSDSVTNSIYISANGGKGLLVAFGMTYEEAKKQYDEYFDKKQKADAEIKVGDEVTPKSNDSNWLGVVVGVDDTNAMVMTRDGYTAMYRLEILKKTDKHFTQVAELLKAMKGGAE